MKVNIKKCWLMLFYYVTSNNNEICVEICVKYKTKIK